MNITQPLVERNVRNQYDLSDTNKYTNYWIALVDDKEEMVGMLGIQVNIKSYGELIPSLVIEEPYSVSFINLYDRDLNTIWWWGCSSEEDEYLNEDCDKDYNKEQDYNRAIASIKTKLEN